MMKKTKLSLDANDVVTNSMTEIMTDSFEYEIAIFNRD